MLKFEFSLLLLSFLFISLLSVIASLPDIDPAGYVVYCPCMGRFGNQADHFLGSLAFAKGIDRTLILPHWVEYRTGEAKSIQVPFEEYFSVQSLKEYHRVITMNDFMTNLADVVWPKHQRISFCYVPRGLDTDPFKSCNAKEGNPFGPFWDTFNVSFSYSEFYAPLHYDVHRGTMANQWKEKYLPEKWPVLAFTGAPASFPVQNENVQLQKYLQWNTNITSEAKKFIKNNLFGGSFIGIHLRNGPDWIRACHHVSQSSNLFSSPQCVGYRNENGPVTHAMCLPSSQEIIKHIKRQIKKLKDVKYIFVASDHNHMMSDLEEAFKRQSLFIRRIESSNPHLDLAILGLSNHFIGNCVSSYSAFVKRTRDAMGLPSSFFAFPAEKPRKSTHDEF